ncbi:MAG TPA: RNA polymerase sigma factor [Polyangiaceae bacterium]|nr:RNA polymerase sigma factor [Polyangiaceae bacterium]
MGTSSPSEDLSTEELFRRFAPFVARFLYRLGVGSDGLDDLVQEVFLVVHRRGGYKAGPAKPTSYLATIAANAASAYRRRRRTEQARSSDVEVEGLVSTNKGPVQVLEVSERLRLLQAALDRLEPDFRSTLVLADIEGESCASIAASSGVPTGTVYWRLHEARKRFQRALRAEMAGVPAKSVRVAGEDAPGAERRERGSVLALALNPLWFFSDARRLLRAGSKHAPVDYDVRVGLEKHRRLAGSTTVPSYPPGIAPTGALAHTSTGIGFVGAGSAGIAAVAAVAAGFFLHSTPPSRQDDVASRRVELPASESATSTTNATPEATAIPAHVEPSPTPGTSTRAGVPLVASVTTPEAAPAPADAPPEKALPSTPSPASSETGRRFAPKAASSSTPAASRESSQPPSPASSSQAAPVASSSAQLEALEIARAERLLSSNPAGALSAVRDARSRFTPSFLPEERDYVEVMALHALGRSGEAETAASRFLKTYPGGAFANRVRKVMAE